MKTKLIRDKSKIDCSAVEGTVACLGNFDGLHLGHQVLFEKLREQRELLQQKGIAAKAVVLSFHPHPAVVLGKAEKIACLTTIRQKLRCFSELGIDYFYLKRFTRESGKIPAEQFIEEVLFRDLKVISLVTGPDAALGHEAEGDVDFLRKYFSKAERELHVVNEVDDLDGRKISSRVIRRLIGEGEVASVEKFLGRKYRVEGKVENGDGRGRKIGYPTANLSSRNQVLPKDGVYATHCYFEGKCFESVTNIGTRPTFDGSDRVVETHLMGSQELYMYGKRIEVEFAERIREEIKFASAEDLRSEIKKDILSSIRILEDIKWKAEQ